VAPPQNVYIDNRSNLGFFAAKGRHNIPSPMEFGLEEYTMGLYSGVPNLAPIGQGDGYKIAQ